MAERVTLVDAHYGGHRTVGDVTDTIVVTIHRLRVPAPPVLTERLYRLCIDDHVPSSYLQGLKLLCAHSSIGDHDSDDCVPEEYRRANGRSAVPGG